MQVLRWQGHTCGRSTSETRAATTHNLRIKLRPECLARERQPMATPMCANVQHTCTLHEHKSSCHGKHSCAHDSKTNYCDQDSTTFSYKTMCRPTWFLMYNRLWPATHCWQLVDNSGSTCLGRAGFRCPLRCNNAMHHSQCSAASPMLSAVQQQRLISIVK